MGTGGNLVGGAEAGGDFALGAAAERAKIVAGVQIMTPNQGRLTEGQAEAALLEAARSFGIDGNCDGLTFAAADYALALIRSTED